MTGGTACDCARMTGMNGEVAYPRDGTAYDCAGMTGMNGEVVCGRGGTGGEGA